MDGDNVNGDDHVGEARRKKGGKSETGSVGQGRLTVDPAVLESMVKKFGLSMAQITTILGEFRYLSLTELTRVIREFAKDIAQASAHLAVVFSGCYTLVVDFCSTIRQMASTPTLEGQLAPNTLG